jgi:aspartyl aminopeptidase
MKKKGKETTRAYAEDLMWFTDASPSPYHAVMEMVRRLENAGFMPYDEKETFALEPGDRGYVIREDSSLLAFVIGDAPPEKAGFSIVGAHTDSPCLKLKPKPVVQKQGFIGLSTEVYGGAITATWTDRDLALAGRVVLEGGKHEMVRVSRPLLRVPNLAIHLNREVNKEGLKLNPQTQLVPIWALEAKAADPKTGKQDVLEALFEELVPKRRVIDFDLCLYDVQKAALSGRDEEFIHSARLDNLASCHSGCEALIESAEKGADHTRVLVCYDHEEIGSTSAQGAAGPFLKQVLTRMVAALSQDKEQAFERAIAHSFCISSDMAHAVHPNYGEMHEPDHMPRLGDGPVIKWNHNQRYATSGHSAARFTRACEAAGVTPQKFVVRSDLMCGSTIGPITSAELGISTVDIGNPMLSMHSIREMAAVADVEKMVRVLERFFRA